MALGLSIYPLKAEKEEIINYLQIASKYNYTWIFTSFLGINTKEELNKTNEIIKTAKDLGYKIQVDIAPEKLDELGLEITDIKYFKEQGYDAIRLDEPYNGHLESQITNNEYGVEIIINGSQDTRYLDYLLACRANTNNLKACHNFYPQAFTGLNREHFLKNNDYITKCGVKVASFITSQNAEYCTGFAKEGCPTLESHRNIPAVNQAKELKFLGNIEDIYFSNMFASEEELKAVSEVVFNTQEINIDLDLNKNLSDIEYTILDELHNYRGDFSDYQIRSTQVRVKYKATPLAANNTSRQLKRGDILVLNDNYEGYAKELQIVLKDFEVEHDCYNVVGRVKDHDLVLLTMMKAWDKFRFTYQK